MDFAPRLLLDGLSFPDTAVLLGSWFGAGLFHPLRASLAVASVLPFAVLGRARLGEWAVWIAFLFVFALGWWASESWEARFALHDDRRIVVDEVAGFLLACALAGQLGWLRTAGLAVVFLMLDRLKPWPINLLESVPSGLGIMIDDLGPALILGLALRFVADRARSRD